jgi:hypothetical protein
MPASRGLPRQRRLAAPQLFSRIELAFPIEDAVAERLISEILATTMADNTKARLLQPDGSYRRAHRAPRAVRRSQFDSLLWPPRHPGAQAKTAKTRYPKVKLAPSPLAPHRVPSKAGVPRADR